MVDFVFRKLPCGITAAFRSLNPDADNRSFASHPQAISSQSFFGVIRLLLHPAVKLVQPIERHRSHPRNPPTRRFLPVLVPRLLEAIDTIAKLVTNRQAQFYWRAWILPRRADQTCRELRLTFRAAYGPRSPAES